MTIKAKKIVSCAVLACLFVYVWWFSANALWLGDDINYQFVFTDSIPVVYSDNTVSDLSEVFQSQYAHYIVANSRYVAYTITQALFIFMNHTLFGLLNGLAYCLFVWLVVKIGLKLREREGVCNPIHCPIAVAYVSIMSILCVSSKFVPTTSIGYTWTYVIALGFVLIYFFYRPKSFVGLTVLAFYAFLAGAAHDTLSLGLAFGLALYSLKNIKRLRLSDWIILISFGLGSITLVLSPGALSRASSSYASIITQLLSLNYLRCFVVMAMICVIARNKGYNFRRMIVKYDIWFVSILGLFVFNMAVGGISGNRQVFGIETLSMILSVAIWPHAKIKKTTTFVCMGIILVVLCVKFYRDNTTIKHTHPKYAEIKEKFAASPDGTIEIEFASGHGAMNRVVGYILGGIQDGLYGEDEGSRYWQTLHMTRLFNHEMGTNKTLNYVVPMAREIKSLPDSTQVIETMPGNYYAIISKANPPKRVVAHRSAFWGLKNWSDFEIYPSSDKPDFETATLEAYAAFDQMYFVGIDSVEVIY